jgi:hypothetical protein
MVVALHLSQPPAPYCNRSLPDETSPGSLTMPMLRATTSAASAKPNRRVSPRCRGGVSSLLRLTQPGAARLPGALELADWVSRAAGAFGRSAATASR